MILVTGATGFLGQSVRRLLGEQDALGLTRGPAEGPGLARADLTDPASLDALPWERLTGVVHCASAIPGRDERYFDVNVVGTDRLLSRLDPRRLRAFVLVSSVAVYGIPPDVADVRLAEDVAPAPTEDYGRSKLAQELLAGQFARGRCRFVCLRPSSIWGPGNTSRTLLPIFVERALAGETLRISGPRAYVQNFVHVDDVARLCSAALTGEVEGTFNAFSDDTLAPRELAARIVEATGSTSAIEDAATDEPYPSVTYDNTRTKAAFGGRFVDFAEGVRAMCA